MSETHDAPESADRFQWAGLVRPGSEVRAGRIAVAVGAAALVAGILIGRQFSPGAEPAPSPSPTTAAVGSPAPSGTGALESTGPEPTRVVAVSGELPTPEAVLPPGTPVIPRLDMLAVAEAAVSLGLTCDSARVRQGDYFWLRCEGLSAAANVRYSVSADYATRDTISAFQVFVGPTVDPSRGGSATAEAAEEILLPFARLVSGLPGLAAQQWIGDRRCTGYPTCIRSSGGVSTMVVAGARPALFVWPTSPGLTPIASPSVVGELPVPDATAPPGVDVIEGLSLGDVLATAASLGMPCQSRTGSFPGSGEIHYNLDCGAQDPTANAEYSVTAYFLNENAVFLLDINLLPMLDLPILDPTTEVRVILPFVTLVGDEAASQWVQMNMDNPSCGVRGDVCARTIGGVYYYVQWGGSGSGSVYIEPSR